MVSLPPDDDYRISIQVFEGPIDLLLYLIRKKELDIHEISLAEVVAEYLEYVEIIKLIDIERAGEFLVVASTLMKIKSRSLFAGEDDDTDGGDAPDPKKDLIRYLMEYEKLGDVAEKLGEQEEQRRSVFPRGGERERVAGQIRDRAPEPDFQLFDLLSIMKEVIRTAPKTAYHKVELPDVTTEMMRGRILAALEEHAETDFLNLVRDRPRNVIVATFIALLELIKERKVRVRQASQFGRIIIEMRKADDG